MSNNVNPIDNEKYCAKDEHGICTGPHATKELAIEALDRYFQLLELQFKVRELGELFDRWERGEEVEQEILECAMPELGQAGRFLLNEADL